MPSWRWSATDLVVGLVTAFSLLNIGWSKLQWMAAGLSVGLGFGLQETAANFFSGLTLLSERSIRVGDVVTVGDKTGVVRRIKVRATTVEDFDGREIVIPNKELVTTQVTNWTLTDSKRRLQVVVGVAYGSDTALVVESLLEAARSLDGVMVDPAPQAVFEMFGDARPVPPLRPGSPFSASCGSITSCTGIDVVPGRGIATTSAARRTCSRRG
jgi:potassium efflux system protein